MHQNHSQMQDHIEHCIMYFQVMSRHLARCGAVQCGFVLETIASHPKIKLKLRILLHSTFFSVFQSVGNWMLATQSRDCVFRGTQWAWQNWHKSKHTSCIEIIKSLTLGHPSHKTAHEMERFYSDPFQLLSPSREILSPEVPANINHKFYFTISVL